MALARRSTKSSGLVALHHEPHALDVVARVAPVALGVELPKYSVFILPCEMRATMPVILRVTSRGRGCRLAIEEDAVREVHAAEALYS